MFTHCSFLPFPKYFIAKCSRNPIALLQSLKKLPDSFCYQKNKPRKGNCHQATTVPKGPQMKLEESHQFPFLQGSTDQSLIKLIILLPGKALSSKHWNILRLRKAAVLNYIWKLHSSRLEMQFSSLCVRVLFVSAKIKPKSLSLSRKQPLIH